MKPLILSGLGIIGGADGPTAVFVTTTADAVLWLSVLLTAVSFGVIFWRRKHQH